MNKKLMIAPMALALVIGGGCRTCGDNCSDSADTDLVSGVFGSKTVTNAVPVVGPAVTPASWLTNFDLARAETVKNQSYCVIKYGVSSGCARCAAAEASIFSKPEFKAWAVSNKVTLLFGNSKDTATRAKIQNLYGAQVKKDCRYADPRAWDWPTVVIIGGTNGITYKGSFLCRTGLKTSSGVKVALTPAGFKAAVESYSKAK